MVPSPFSDAPRCSKDTRRGRPAMDAKGPWGGRLSRPRFRGGGLWWGPGFGGEGTGDVQRDSLEAGRLGRLGAGLRVVTFEHGDMLMGGCSILMGRFLWDA
jgi:hypothetical protein